MAVVAAVALLAAGCQASARSDFWIVDAGSSIRCASGQALVGEWEDRDDKGRYPSGAATAANKDLYCSNEDTISPGWTYLTARSLLYVYNQPNSVILCSHGPTTTATGSSHHALSATSGRCGQNKRYYTAGQHGAHKVLSSERTTTFSPEVVNP